MPYKVIAFKVGSDEQHVQYRLHIASLKRSYNLEVLVHLSTGEGDYLE